MKKEFVPKSFCVPESLERDTFCLQILSPTVAVMDYKAVMSSKIRLRSIFSDRTEWPKDTMSFEDNRRDLERHEKDFKLRKAFAYTILSPTREQCIGCVYIDPCKITEFDCEVYLWVSDDSHVLDNDLYSKIRRWLEQYWPFKKIAFPGREISWKKWKAYVEKQ